MSRRANSSPGSSLVWDPRLWAGQCGLGSAVGLPEPFSGLVWAVGRGAEWRELGEMGVAGRGVVWAGVGRGEPSRAFDAARNSPATSLVSFIDSGADSICGSGESCPEPDE